LVKNHQNSTREIWLKITKFAAGSGGVLGYHTRPLASAEDHTVLLHCETDNGEAAAEDCAWLHAETLETLVELNELSLAVLAEQAAARGAAAGLLLRQVAEVWRPLDAAARRRAASCPYLLVDAGFADPLRWRPAPAPQVGDAADASYTAFFTVPAAAMLARLVFTYAWHLARTQTAAARLLLGMPAPSVALIGHYTLCQIQVLAETHLEWLRPRWPARVQVWRELLQAAASGEAAPLERARLRGLTLLAAEARLAPRLERGAQLP
jgi:hypothetical protein